jgi:acyl carrier protein
MSTEEQLRQFFTSHGKLPLPADREAFLRIRFLDEGLIDSLGIISLITELEEERGIHFSADDLESYEFQSIGGLIGIVERLQGPAA